MRTPAANAGDPRRRTTRAVNGRAADGKTRRVVPASSPRTAPTSATATTTATTAAAPGRMTAASKCRPAFGSSSRAHPTGVAAEEAYATALATIAAGTAITAARASAN